MMCIHKMKNNKKYRKMCMYNERIKAYFMRIGLDTELVGQILERKEQSLEWGVVAQSEIVSGAVSGAIVGGATGGLAGAAVGTVQGAAEGLLSMALSSSTVEAVANQVGNMASNGMGGTREISTPHVERELVTSFNDGTVGEVSTSVHKENSVDQESVQRQIDLGKFLSRPIRIGQFGYSGATTPLVPTEWSPWELFFNNPSIKRKTYNYGFFRGTLHVKFILNCSPFFYGSLMVCYAPIADFPIYNLGPGNEAFIRGSQRQHIMLKPQDSQGGEMELPFFFHKKMCPLNSVDTNGLGKLHIVPITQLRTSNGSPAPNITVTAYAWLTNVELAGTTAYGQSADVSEEVIRISKGIAHSGEHNTDKLTVSKDANIKASPAFYNITDIDEMNIKYLCKKECIYRVLDLPLSTPINNRILAIKCRPTQYVTGVSSDGIKIFSTPMTYIGNLFKYWRGNVIYKFEFVKTKYHKGRIRMTYDPILGSVPSGVDDANVRVTEIIDLELTDSFEFEVPFVSSFAWLRIPGLMSTMENFTTTTVGDYNPDQGFEVGTLQLSLETVITAPGVSDPLCILVSCRGADNIEFAQPVQLPEQIVLRGQSSVTPVGFRAEDESQVESQMGDVDLGAIVSESEEDGYMGESVTSLYQLCTRMNYFRNFCASVNIVADKMTIIQMNQSVVPWFRGWYNSGDYNPGSTFKMFVTPYYIEYVKLIPMTYLMPCFVGQRGGITWYTKPVLFPGNVNYMGAYRTSTNANLINTSPYDYTQKWQAATAVTDWSMKNTTQGESLAADVVEPYFKITSPNYNHVKFYFNYPYSRDKDEAYWTHRGLGYVITYFPEKDYGDNAVVMFEQHVAASSDWKLLYFVDCPPLIRLSTYLPYPES